MVYIRRSLENKILEISKDYSCLLLTGPRQVGKSTILEHLMEGTNRTRVSLDDIDNRRLASSDPEMFLKLHPAPVLIDEVQYAPELFSYIKILIDNGAEPGSYWLTGSQAFSLMKLSQESLAGRVAIIQMSALSQAEIYGDGTEYPLSLDLENINERKKHRTQCSPLQIFERIWKGGMPGHISGKFKDRDMFYSSYIQSYINRDVTDMVPGTDKLLFEDFIRASACRTGQQLNIHSIASDVGISDDTAKRWIKILEQSAIIFFLRPYSNNLLKRTIKTPKMYFFDTGLVSYLTKYSSADILMNGAINGTILENYVVSELKKTWSNSGKECLLHYYRDKDTNEIDLIIENDGLLHPLEIKKTTNPGTQLVSRFKVLDKSTVTRGMGAILCLKEELSAINKDNIILPIWMI